MHRGLITSAVGLHLALVASQKTPHVGVSPRPPQYSKSRIHLLYPCQDDENFATFPSSPSTAERQHLVAPLAHAASINMPGSQVVACAIFRRCTAPKSLSNAKQPTAVRCKPSHPIVLLLQAQSSDAVPCRTNSYQAMLAAAARCKQPKPTSMRQPLPPT